jgi:hypothetical protein
MFQSFLNAFLGCSHQHTTFPLTPARKSIAFPAAAAARTYVVCLDCGKEFAYNWQEMRIGAPVGALVPAAEVQPSFR